MLRTTLRSGVCLGVMLTVSGMTILTSATHGRRASEAAGPAGEIERGKYLVEEVAKCPECHSARDKRGALKHDVWLRGARMWIRPVAPIRNWAARAPALAGLPSFSEQQVETVLEKGTGPNGEELRPPMHVYHMNSEDAQAIVAYLKSLPAGPSTE